MSHPHFMLFFYQESPIADNCVVLIPYSSVSFLVCFSNSLYLGRSVTDAMEPLRKEHFSADLISIRKEYSIVSVNLIN